MGSALASFCYATLLQAIFLSSALRVSQAAQPSLQANVSRLIQNRQPVQVSIRGVQRPTAADVVALYLSGDPDLKNSVPLKYRWLTDAKGYLESGSADSRYFSLFAPNAFGFIHFTFQFHASGAVWTLSTSCIWLCHVMARLDMS